MRAAILGMLLLAPCNGSTDIQSLYEKGRLFDLRDAVAEDQATPFLRAVVACSFNDHLSCLAETQAILDSTPSPELAAKVYDLIIAFHFVHGQWDKALGAAEAQAALSGGSKGAGDICGLCRAFAPHGPLAVEHSDHSSIHVLYKNAHVPFRINGRPYHGYIDTGANISSLSESALQAQRRKSNTM